MTAAAVARRPRILVITDEPVLERLIRELLGTILPSAAVEGTTPAEAPLAAADYAVIDHAVRAAPAFSVAQELRARGFRGGLVLLESGLSSEPDSHLLSIAPAARVARTELTDELPRALGALASAPVCGGELGALERDLRRAQQVMAAGEVTTRIQHTLNNPLTALLAEAQVLELELLQEEHRASIRRIIEQARRVVAIVRGMEGRGGGGLKDGER
jgi:signal transduction histidine kinase